MSEFGAVRYAGTWDGIDVVYRHADGKQVEFDLVVAPGADPNAAGFAVRGADAHVDQEERLVLTTSSGQELTQSAPVVYQIAANGERESVAGAYQLRTDGTVGFELGAYDSGRELVIDPVLGFSGTLGGSAGDTVTGAAAAPDGGTILVGSTTSSNFPTAGSPFDPTYGGNSDAFVTKLSATGSVVWSRPTRIAGEVAWTCASGLAVLHLGQRFSLCSRAWLVWCWDRRMLGDVWQPSGLLLNRSVPISSPWPTPGTPATASTCSSTSW